MPQDDREDDQSDVEFSITSLRPPHPRSAVWLHARLDPRWWRRAAVGISLMLTLAVLLSSLPATREFFGRPSTAFASPTATPNIVTDIQVQVEPGTLIETPMPTPLPGVSGVPPLGTAPTSCPQRAARLQNVGPGSGRAIGGPSVWVTGFARTYPTLTLRSGGQATIAPFGWPLLYSQYGWPAAITVVLAPSMQVPVVLVGSDPRNNQPLWFGFAARGYPPTNISMSLTLDPDYPTLPADGTDATGAFWNAYIFLPREGCYTLAAHPLSSTSDGAWSVMFSAGR